MDTLEGCVPKYFTHGTYDKKNVQKPLNHSSRGLELHHWPEPEFVEPLVLPALVISLRMTVLWVSRIRLTILLHFFPLLILYQVLSMKRINVFVLHTPFYMAHANITVKVDYI